MKPFLIALSLATVACSGSVNPIAPSGTIAPTGTNAEADRKNCDPPAWENVYFDPSTNGRVTIANVSRCTNDYLLVLWKTNGSDELLDQTVAGQVSATLAPGEVRSLEVEIPEECTRYAVDLYFGTKTANPHQLRNYLVQWSAPESVKVFYTSGREFSGRCGPPLTPCQIAPTVGCAKGPH